MRMRRVKWAHDFLEQQPHLIKEPETMKGKWKQLLNKETLHVEIGCGKGDYWVQMKAAGSVSKKTKAPLLWQCAIM